MIELPCEAEIHCTAERIFDLIADVRGQGRWLPHSPAFRGTADLSANPVVLGTTYREPSAFGTRHGTVTASPTPEATERGPPRLALTPSREPPAASTREQNFHFGRPLRQAREAVEPSRSAATCAWSRC